MQSGKDAIDDCVRRIWGSEQETTRAGGSNEMYEKVMMAIAMAMAMAMAMEEEAKRQRISGDSAEKRREEKKSGKRKEKNKDLRDKSDRIVVYDVI